MNKKCMNIKCPSHNNIARDGSGCNKIMTFFLIDCEEYQPRNEGIVKNITITKDKSCQNGKCENFDIKTDSGTNCRIKNNNLLLLCPDYTTEPTPKLDVNFRPDRKNPVWVEVKDNKQSPWKKRILLLVNDDDSCLCICSTHENNYKDGNRFTTNTWEFLRPIPEKKTRVMTDAELFKAGAVAFRSKNHKNSINSLLWVNDDLCIVLDKNSVMGITQMAENLKRESAWTADRENWSSFEVEA